MRLSILRKSSLPLIPLMLVGVLVGLISFRSLSNSTSQLRDTWTIVVYAQKAQVFATDISNHMGRYMLDPTQTKALTDKATATEQLNKAMDEMRLKATNLELFELADKLTEIDEKQLKPAESKILKLNNEGKPKESLAVYSTEYIPALEAYLKSTEALVVKAKEAAEVETNNIDQGMKMALRYILLSLGGGIVLVALVQIYISIALSRNLREVASKLASGADVVAGASEQISNSSKGLLESGISQAEALQETVATIDEVSAMVDMNAANAKNSEQYTLNSEKVLELGRQTVERMLFAIDEIGKANREITDQIELSNKEVSGIAQVISEIGNKTKVINDIVFQTKLLSFNASVEAARAGEHGKGFSVVAEEVGNLAQMSGAAAQEISQILETSIKRVDSVVKNTRDRIDKFVRHGNEKIEAGTKISKEFEKVFDQIVADAQELRKMIVAISTASNEQSIGVQGINQALNQIDDVAQQNTANSKLSATAADELKAQVDGLRNMVDDLIVTVEGQKASMKEVFKSLRFKKNVAEEISESDEGDTEEHQDTDAA